MASNYSAHHLEVFVDAVRLKSFSAVARKNGLTASSVARQINSLEEELGVALFLRSTRSLILTEAGRILFERSERILEDLDEAKREAMSLRKEVRGSVRLCCWPSFAKKLILPHLPGLAAQYPELRVDLDLSERLHEPALGRTDLVIRIGDLADSALLATRLGTQHSVIAASPAYLARYGTPQTLEECANHRLIDKRHFAQYMGWRVLLGQSRTLLRQLVLQTDDLQAQSDACAGGLGLIYVPQWSIADRLQSGELIGVELHGVDLTRPAAICLLRNPGTPTAPIEAISHFLRDRVCDINLLR